MSDFDAIIGKLSFGGAAAPPAEPAPGGDLHDAVMQTESGGREDAVSPKGALGPMQVMPATAAKPGFGIQPAVSRADYTRVGHELLDKMVERYPDDIDAALVAYNAGPGVADAWVRSGKTAPIPAETQAYIQKVKARLAGRPGETEGALRTMAGGDPVAGAFARAGAKGTGIGAFDQGNVFDSVLGALPTPTAPQKSGIIESAVAGARSIPASIRRTYEGGKQMLGTTLGNDEMAAEGQRGVAAADAELEKISPTHTSLGQVETPSDVARVGAFGVVSNAPSLAGSIAGAGVGALAGGALGSVVPVIGTAAGATAGSLAGGAAASYVMNSVDNFLSYIKEGMDPKTAAVRAELVGVPQAALDTILPARVAKMLFPGVSSLAGPTAREAVSISRGLLARAGIEGLKDAGIEATTETLQQMLQDAASDKPFFSKENAIGWADNAFIGGLLGGATGAAGGALHKPHAAPGPTDPGAPPAGETAPGLPPGAPPPAGPTAGATDAGSMVPPGGPDVVGAGPGGGPDLGSPGAGGGGVPGPVGGAPELGGAAGGNVGPELGGVGAAGNDGGNGVGAGAAAGAVPGGGETDAGPVDGSAAAGGPAPVEAPLPAGEGAAQPGGAEEAPAGAPAQQGPVDPRQGLGRSAADRAQPAETPTGPVQEVTRRSAPGVAEDRGGGGAGGAPLAITKAMRRELLGRGYSFDEIRNMRPERAGEILRSDERKERPSNVGDGTPTYPVHLNSAEDIRRVERVTATHHEVGTSPTKAQLDSGNYAKGHGVLFAEDPARRLDLAFENARGSTRSGTGPGGKRWSVKMPAPYGYVKKTAGADSTATKKEGVDFYLGDKPRANTAYVVDQIDPETGRFDEHKLMLGMGSQEEALRTYLDGFSDGSGPRRLGAVTPISMADLKTWLKGDTSKALGKIGEAAGTHKIEKLAQLQEDREASDRGEKAAGSPASTFSDIADKEKAGTEAPAEPNGGDQGSSAADNGRDSAAGSPTPGPGHGPIADGAEAIPPVSEWATPDSARPAPAKGDRLIILACSERKAAGRGRAMDVYDGEFYRQIKARGAPADVLILSAKHGFIRADHEIDPYDQRMTPERAKELVGDKGQRIAIRQIIGDHPYKEVLLVASGEYLPVVDAFRDALPEDAILERTKGQIGEQKSQLAGWLDRPGARKLPADLRAEAETKKRLDALKEQTVIFASGMTRPKDMEAGGFAWGGYKTRGLGIDVGQLSENGLDTLARQVVDRKAQIFVDSGAYGVFRRNAKKAEGGKQLALELVGDENVPPDFEAVDFDEVLKRYDRIAQAIEDYNEAEDTDASKPLVVMPDVIGDQKASLDLIREHAHAIKTETEFNVSRPIIPIPVGELSLADAYREIVKTLGTDNFIVGIPAKSKVVGLDALKAFVEDAKPKRLHFLGAGHAKTLEPRLRVLAETGLDFEHVSADSNLLRAALYGRAHEGKPRAKAIADTLTDRAPNKDREEKLFGPFGTPDAPNADHLSDAVAHYLGGPDGRFETIIEARNFLAERVGGALDPKRAEEIVEIGVVKAARSIVTASAKRDEATTFTRLVDLYKRQPRLDQRTSTSVYLQQYSTPAPIAYLASRLAGITRDTKVLEPTAGNGMLLIEASPINAEVNEIDPERAAALRGQGYRVTSGDAALGPMAGASTMDVVIANPPFGKRHDKNAQPETFTVDDWQTREIDHAIALRALKAMKDDGRAVLIIGGKQGTEEERRQQYNVDKQRAFFFRLYRDYNVTKHFTVNGDLYQRQGASWPVDVILIEGRGKSNLKLPGAQPPAVIDTFKELGGFLDVTNDSKGSVRLGPDGRPAGAGGGDSDGAPVGTGKPAGLGKAPSGKAGGDVAGAAGGGDGSGAAPTPGLGDAGRPDAHGQPGAGGDAAVGGGRGGRGRDGRGGKRGEVAGEANVEPGAAEGGSGNDDGRVAVGGDDGAGGSLDALFDEEFDKLFADEKGQLDLLGGPTVSEEDLAVREAAEREIAQAFDAHEGDKDAAREALKEELDYALARGRDFDRRVFDEALAILGQPPRRIPMRKEGTAKPNQPRKPSIRAGAKKAVTETASGLDQAMAGLAKLFGAGPGRLNSGISFDPETYRQAKPLFQQAASHFKAAGLGAREVIAAILQHAKDVLGWPAEAIRRMKPYIIRFAEDLGLGDKRGDKKPTPKAPAPVEGAEGQVEYKPASKGEPMGTLVPVNQQAAITRALKALEAEVGPLDTFVAKKLGYKDSAEMTEQQDGYDTPFMGAEQIDALALAIRNVEAGGAFIIGDQTGIGKGRFVAGMIRFAQQQGKIPVFVTKDAALYADIMRDIRDTGTKLDDFNPLITDRTLRGGKKIPVDKPDEDGSVRYIESLTKSKLDAAEAHMIANGTLPDGHTALFTTYSQMQFKGLSEEARNKGEKPPMYERQKAVKALIPNALIVLDESHEAGGQGNEENDKGETTNDAGRKVSPGRAEFMRELVMGAWGAVYSSATFAKRPEVMTLYARTNMRLAVDKLSDLGSTIAAGGVPLQQVTSAMMVEDGQMMRRERSWKGVSLEQRQVEIDTETSDKVSAMLRDIYALDRKFESLHRHLDKLVAELGYNVKRDDSHGEGGLQKHTSFASILHNIVSQALLALKTRPVIELAKKAIENGEKPVIAVSNTMGAVVERYMAQKGLGIGDEVGGLTFGEVFINYLRRSREIVVKDAEGEKHRIYLTKDMLKKVGAADLDEEYAGLEKKIRKTDFGKMPPSPIDAIIEGLKDAGIKTGEITGRQVALVGGHNRTVFEARDASKAAKKKTMRGFNNGDLDALVINRSGSTGFSLHASPANGKDVRPRRMMVLQADPNIDTFMQMLGRIHRTGQVELPRYDIVVSDLPAEKRPAAVLMGKMAALNANTTAKAEGAVALKVVDYINRYGDMIVAQWLIEHPDFATLLHVWPNEDPERNQGIATKTTGRMLNLFRDEQEEAFTEIEQRYTDLIAELDATGDNELVARTLPLEAKLIERTVTRQGKGDDSLFSGPVHLEKVDVKRIGKPMKPEEVQEAILDTLRSNGQADAAEFMREIRVGWTEAVDAYIGGIEADHNAAIVAHSEAEAAAKAGPTDAATPEEAKVKQDALAAETERASIYKARVERALNVARANRREIERFLRNYSLGQRLNVTNNRTKESFNAQVIDVEYRPGKVATAFGQFKLVVAVDDAIRKIPISGSQFMRQAVETEKDDKNKKPAKPAKDEGEDEGEGKGPKWSLERSSMSQPEFDRALTQSQSQTRETRAIMTGNLLAGYAQFRKEKGRIVYYTTADGETRQGILMPRSFDIGRAISTLPEPLENAKQVIEFLVAVSAKGRIATLKSGDGGLMVVLDGHRVVFQADRKTGKQFLQVAKAYLGEFQARKGPFLASASREIAEKAIQTYIDVLGTTFEAERDQDIARAIKGVAEPTAEPAPQVDPAVGWDTVEPGDGAQIPPAEEAKAAVLKAWDAMRLPRENLKFAKDPIPVPDGTKTMRESGGGDGSTAGGVTVGNVAAVAIGVVQPEINAWHEGFHVLQNTVMDAAAKKVLAASTATMRKLAAAAKVIPEDSPIIAQMSEKELQAYAFQYAAMRWGAGQPVHGLLPPVRRWWHTLWNLLTKVRNALSGAGFNSIDDIMRSAYTGELGAQVKPASAAERDAFVRDLSRWAQTEVNPDAAFAVIDRDLGRTLKEAFVGVKPDEGVTRIERKEAGDVPFLMKLIATPEAIFRRYSTAFHKVWQQATKWVHDSDRYATELRREIAAGYKGLSKEEITRVDTMTWLGEGAGTVFTDEELRRGYTESEDGTRQWLLGDGIVPNANEVRAYRAVRSVYEKAGRIVDNHERDMAKVLRARKMALVGRLAEMRHMEEPAFAALMQRLADTLSAFRRADFATATGEDPGEIARRLDALEREVYGRFMNEEGDLTSDGERFSRAYEEWKQIEARLQSTSVRRHVGYVNHAFVGSWAVYKVIPHEGPPDREGRAPQHFELVADPKNGFFTDSSTATRYANAYAAENPGSRLVVRPREFKFPNSQATQLTDAAYNRFLRRVSDTLEIDVAEAREQMREVARKRYRRRIPGFKLHREGIEGFVKDLPRAIDLHIGNVTRYLAMDRFKYAAINAQEQTGLSPNRSSVQDRPVLAAVVDQWIKDINGQKQATESYVDELLNKPWVTPLNAALATGGTSFLLSGGMTGNPFVGALIGSYVGYSTYKAMGKGDFKSRALTGSMLRHMTHLKLGSFLNVFTPLVNLTQTLLNTLPVLGIRSTMAGTTRYMAAMRDLSLGRKNLDIELLQRAGIQTGNNGAEEAGSLFRRESRIAKASLFLFQRAEHFNRGVAFLGALAKIEREQPGISPAAAKKYAEGVVNRTQFDYSSVNKPELLRNVFLRVPLQFKNFVAQQIAFLFSLNKSEAARFMVSMFLVAGTIGLPGWDMLDGILDTVFGWSPLNYIRKAMLKLGAEGGMTGDAVTFLARGLPAMFGVDLSSRAGMGDKFLPSSLRDLQGPWWTTISTSAEFGKHNAHWVDQIRNLSPGIGAPLKSVEAAANGMPLLETIARGDFEKVQNALGDGKAVYTNPYQRNRPEFEPTNAELALKAMGGNPTRETKLRDLRAIRDHDTKDVREHTAETVDRIVAGIKAGDTGEVQAAIKDAASKGVLLTPRQILDAVKASNKPRLERLIQQTPKQLRPEIRDLYRGILDEGA